MKPLRTLLLLALVGLLAAAPAPVFAHPKDSLLSPADLRFDAEALRRTFEALHPGLHRYNTEAQLDAAFSELYLAFQRPLSLPEAYLAFSKLAAKVRCGHTYLNPNNQTKAIKEALFGGPRVPFLFRWLDGKMIVTKSLTADARLLPGTEIVSLNGISAKELLPKLLTISRADGSNDFKRIANLEVQGAERYETFDVYLPLFYPLKTNQFALKVRAPGGAVARFTVAGQTPDERKSSLPTDAEGELDDAHPFWTIRSLDAHTGYLKMPTWAVYNNKRDWKADLKLSLDQLIASGADELIIDLRGNEGGNDVGNEILSRFIEKDLPLAGLQRWTRYRRVSDELRPGLETWDNSFFDWGEQAVEMPNGFYRLTKYDDDKNGDVIPAVAPRFTGKVVVLVDSTNSSATFQFDQIVQSKKLGTLLGQPTGGNQRGINGGAFFFYHLPKSGIEIDLPLIGRFPADGKVGALPNAGLLPDLPVSPTAKDIAAGNDVELQAAQSLPAAH